MAAKRRLHALLAASLIGATTPVFADEASDALAKARDRVAAGETLEADAAIEELRDALLAPAPLAFRQILVAEAEATGLGVYKPRASSDFRNGQAMIVYIEPVGFGYGDDGLGNNLIDLRCDVVLFDDKGAELGTFENIGQMRMATRARPRDLFLNITLSFDKSPFPVGSYAFDVILKDVTTGKEAKAPIRFRITG